MERKDLLKEIWKLPMYPHGADTFSSIMGVAYEAVDTGQTKKYIEWFDDPEKLDADLAEKVLSAGAEAMVHVFYLERAGYYRGVPVRRKA